MNDTTRLENKIDRLTEVVTELTRTAVRDQERFLFLVKRNEALEATVNALQEQAKKHSEDLAILKTKEDTRQSGTWAGIKTTLFASIAGAVCAWVATKFGG